MVLGDSFTKYFRAAEWVSVRTICAYISRQVASWDGRRTEWAALLFSAVRGNRRGSASLTLSVGGRCQKNIAKNKPQENSGHFDPLTKVNSAWFYAFLYLRLHSAEYAGVLRGFCVLLQTEGHSTNLSQTSGCCFAFHTPFWLIFQPASEWINQSVLIKTAKNR